MKTGDLINGLVADNATVARPISRTVLYSLIVGTALAAAIFFATMGLRGDFWWSIVNSPRFIFKFVVTLGVAIPAYFAVKRLASPEQKAGKLIWALALVALLLLASVPLEMALIPADHWKIYQIGSNSMMCMTLIPALSLAPLAAVLYALRQGAPANPTLAGAFGGLLSAGVGATLYASHCVDDSPLFIATWYPLAFGIVVALGGLLGSRLLRW